MARGNNKSKDAKAKDGVRLRTNKKTSPKKAAAPPQDMNSLKRSFENSKGKEKDVQDVTKGMQSSFITYVKFCCSSKDNTASEEAVKVLNMYQKLNPTEKKQLIQNFYASGGKRAGLKSIYQQTLSLEDLLHGGSWSGYCTPAKLFELHGVLGV